LAGVLQEDAVAGGVDLRAEVEASRLIAWITSPTVFTSERRVDLPASPRLS